MSREYQLAVDIWEADVLLDEALLLENDIWCAIIRLNSMAGGHHMDKNFTAQWKQAGDRGMLRAIYFVYNPWVNAAENYKWLKANLPAGYKGRIFVDVEVRYEGYSPITYAEQVSHFCDMVSGTNKVTIYTGYGYVGLLKIWPKLFDYWWAQYLTVLYPKERKEMTWAQVRAIADTLQTGPTNAKYCPGTVKLWQVSGDRLILPGSAGRAIDVNIFYGSKAELAAWIGDTTTVPPVDPPPVEPPVPVTLPQSVTLTFWADGKTTATDWRK